MALTQGPFSAHTQLGRATNEINSTLISLIGANLSLFQSIPPDISVGEILEFVENYNSTAPGDVRARGLPDRYYDSGSETENEDELHSEYGHAFSTGVTIDTLGVASESICTGELASNAVRAVAELHFWLQPQGLALVLNSRQFRETVGEHVRVCHDRVEELLTVYVGRSDLFTLETEEACQEFFQLLKPGLGKQAGMITQEGIPLVSRATGIVDPDVERLKLNNREDRVQYDSLLALPRDAKRHILQEVYENSESFNSHYSYYSKDSSTVLTFKNADLISFRTADKPWLKRQVSANAKFRRRARNRTRASGLVQKTKPFRNSNFYEVLALSTDDT